MKLEFACDLLNESDSWIDEFGEPQKNPSPRLRRLKFGRVAVHARLRAFVFKRGIIYMTPFDQLK